MPPKADRGRRRRSRSVESRRSDSTGCRAPTQEERAQADSGKAPPAPRRNNPDLIHHALGRDDTRLPARVTASARCRRGAVAGERMDAKVVPDDRERAKHGLPTLR